MSFRAVEGASSLFGTYAPEGAKVYKIVSPNGKYVEVQASCDIFVSSQEFSALGRCLMHDDRDEVWVDSPKGALSSELPMRALPNIDYAQYGFTKIGTVWVDPNNARDVRNARAAL